MTSFSAASETAFQSGSDGPMKYRLTMPLPGSARDGATARGERAWHRGDARGEVDARVGDHMGHPAELAGEITERARLVGLRPAADQNDRQRMGGAPVSDIFMKISVVGEQIMGREAHLHFRVMAAQAGVQQQTHKLWLFRLVRCRIRALREAGSTQDDGAGFRGEGHHAFRGPDDALCVVSSSVAQASGLLAVANPFLEVKRFVALLQDEFVTLAQRW